jgi:drug/metabolite transporter (DMT)-like permease
VAAGGLLLDEPLGPGLIAALALMASGIYLVNRPTPMPSRSGGVRR